MACLGAIFAFGSTIVVFLVACRLGYWVMQRVVISLAFGADRYAAGLRVVGKQDLHLSDGTPLGYGWKWVYMLGLFACVLLVAAPYVLLLQKFGLLRNGDDEREEKENPQHER